MEAPEDPGARAAVLYSPDGRRTSLDELVAAASEVDVVFVGERHGDVSAHRLQLALLEALLEEGTHPDRQIILSLEMFETDVQLVVDEYLAGFISEDHFLAAVRPWPNYRRDYRPLVELAAHTGIRVVAANAPRRYVNRVARLGREALDDLPEGSAALLPPLPYVGPSEAYRSEWNQRMHALAEGHGQAPVDAARNQGAHGHGGEATMHEHAGREDPALQAQALWDAAMAYSIHRALDCSRSDRSGEEGRSGSSCPETRAPPLVVHLTGSFHVENRTGTPEALRHFRPNVRDLIVTVRAVEDPANFDEAFDGAGAGEVADFILLTPLSSGHP
ncbi:MAG: ChaN family lipoprotein [Gemmatimonadota bacterium]